MQTSPDTVKELKWIRTILVFLALPVLVIILQTLQALFIPLVFAIFLTFMFAPLKKWLLKHKVPMGITLLLIVVVIFLILTIIGGVVYAAVSNFVVQLPKYQAKFAELLQSTIAWGESLAQQKNGALEKLPLDISNSLSPGNFSLTGFITGMMGTFATIMGSVLLTLIFLIFLMAGSQKMESRLKKVLTEEKNSETLSLMQDVQLQVQRYFVNKSLLSLMVSVSAMVILWLFGIDFVIITGVIYFIMNFIPNIGSVISISFPMLVCLLQYGFDWRIVALLVALLANEMVFSNILEPRFMGDKMNLAPIMIIISLIFWGYVWGPVGMVIAVPLTSVINLIIQRINNRSIISAVISDN